MKIAVLSSHTQSLFWFRIDLMKDFIRLGHTVIAIGPESETKWKDKFYDYGITYHCVPVSKNGLNPLNDLKTLVALHQLLKTEQPDKIFSYQAKTIIYGSIAGKLNGIKEIYLLIAGLGSILRGKGIKNACIKPILKFQYKIACSLSKKVFFQNKDDLNEFINSNLIEEKKCIQINGSGVNLDKFKPTSFPASVSFLYIGRLIKDKGILEYLEACRMIKEQFPEIRCLLVGPYDTNPSALKPNELHFYIDRKIVEYFGEQSDVRPFISQCSVYVLPSYHEGTPKTVLEAMAMNRPIITTNVPGCRETVVNGVNGFLVPFQNAEAVADKMKWFILNPENIELMGMKSLQLCKEKFDVKKVNKDIISHMNF